jgi:hypothetical protein
MRMTSLLLAAILGLPTWTAQAHGVPVPKHGGLVDVGGEISFELVLQGREARIHIEDHGKPVATRGAHGELLRGSETGARIATLREAGGNAVTGRTAPFVPGERLYVRVTLGDGSIVVGEFRIPNRSK